MVISKPWTKKNGRKGEQQKDDKAYAIRGTKFLLTYDVDDYLDKNRLSEHFQRLSPVRELYINFHLGITRVAVWFKKQFTRKYPDIFRFGETHPTIETIVGKGDGWLKAISSFSESDKMAIRIKEHPRLKQRELKREREEKLLEKEQRKRKKEQQRELTVSRKKTLNRERVQKCRERQKNASEQKPTQRNMSLKPSLQDKQNEGLQEQINKQNELISGLQEQINKQNELISGLQEQINKQNEIIAKLQDHVAQVFGGVLKRMLMRIPRG